MRLIQCSPHKRRLADEAMLAYIEWREECAAVWQCYGRLRTTNDADALAHAAYRAALDREEAAASVYERRLELLGDALRSRHV